MRKRIILSLLISALLLMSACGDKNEEKNPENSFETSLDISLEEKGDNNSSSEIYSEEKQVKRYDNGAEFYGTMKDGEPWVGIVTFADGSAASYNAATQKLSYTDGDIYIGALKDFVYEGEGTYYEVRGVSFHGFWVAGDLAGGVITYADGSRYEGAIKNMTREGYGYIEFASGAVYEGNFHDGAMHGEGFMTWPDGMRYEGNYVNSQRSGQGRYLDNGRVVYEGEWFEDKQDGKGIYYYENGSKYVGTFRNHKMDTRLVNSSHQFMEDGKGGYMHGDPAKVYDASGDIVEGFFEEGKMTLEYKPPKVENS